MRYAVFGAGVSGLAIARRLYEKGADVTIYELCAQPGGLAKTRVTNGYVYDMHGGHIFNSKHPEVMDWVFSILPRENWHFSVRNAKVYINGRYISYPFELSLCELDTDTAVECVHDYLLSQNGPEPNNYRDWITWNFGKGIADYYMLPYNEKIWAYPLEEMETNWMRGKMPLPDKKEIIKSLLLKDSSERKMPHSTFYYPIEGGIQALINAMADGLSIALSTPVERVEYVGGKWLVNGDAYYDRVVSTIPLPELSAAMNLPDKVKKAIGGLKYNSLNSALFKCVSTDMSWLYIPEKKYRIHKIGYQGAVSPRACPSNCCSCGIETTAVKTKLNKEYFLKAAAELKELGVSDMIDNAFAKYAYVIFDKDYRKNIEIIKSYFDTINNFSLLGRFATWNYNNMDICMLEAFRLCEELCRRGG